MNSCIDTLNHWGGRFAGFALPMLLQSSLLIVLLFAFDLVLRNRVRAVVRYGLWMLVLIKLVLPPSFAAPTSLAYWLSEKKAVKTPPASSQQFVVRYSDVKLDEARPIPSLPQPHAKLQIAGWLLLGWLATAVSLMAWLVRRSRSVVQTAARALPASELPEQLLDGCRQQLGIKQRVRLKLSATPSSPAVCGLWRPVVLIPQQLADKLSALQLRAVLLHELAHIRRGDVWVHYAQTLLQICYWWHPLFWLANAQIRRVREQAVDEAVVVAMGSEAEAYPATLVEVAKLAFQRPARALGLIGIVESKSTLALRIQRLLDRPVPKSAKLGFTRLAAVALIGAALLPMARGERKPGALAAASTPRSLIQSAAIEVEVKFVSLTDAALENLLGFRPKTIAASGHFVWTLSPAERIELLQRMERQPDAATLSAPPVTTMNARQAQMAVDGIQPFLHPRAHTSAACQVIPYQIGSSLDLVLSAKITESGDVGPAFGDDSSRNQKEDTNDARSGAKSNQVYAVNAVGYINYDVGTAQTLVGDGGAVILQNPALTGADERRILVVVSPRVVRQSGSANTPGPNAVSLASSSSSAARPREETRVRPTPTTKSAQAQRTGPAPKDYANEGVRETLTVTITKTEPYLYLGSKPVSIQELKAELERLTARKSAGAISLRADHDAPLTEIVKVAEAAKAVGLPKSYVSITSPQTNAPAVLETNPGERVGKQSSSEAAPSNSVPLLDDPPSLGRQYAWEARPDSPGREAIQAKLNRIVLPEIGFDNVPLPEALQWLVKVAGARDPEGRGVVFLVNPYVIGPALPTNVDPNTGEPVTLPPPEPMDMNNVIVRINPPLKNVRLADALDAIVRVADKPIRYWVEAESVVFARKSAESTQLETRIFKVESRTFIESLGRRFPDRGANDVPGLVKDFFTASGVNVLPPNTIFYKDRTGVLMVRATAEELDRVQKAIEALNSPRQEKPTAQSPPTSARAAKPGRAATGPPDSANSATQLETRTFRVDPKTFIDGLRNLQVPEADLPTATDGIEIDRNTTKPRTFIDSSLNVKLPVDDPSDRLGARLLFSPFSSPNRSPQTLVRSFFTAAGVNVQPPNAVFFNDRTGVLMVRATTTELDIVQKALEMLNDRPSQITIEAKFMELPTEAARQVGLDLPPPDRASDTWTRILNAAQTRAVLHAAEQHDGVDVLSVPKITTLSGRQAQIQAVEIKTIVNGIAPEALAPPGVQSTNSNPAQPYLTSQIPCGPTLDVLPHVAADGYTIHLTALPQVTEFLRYNTTLNGAKETRVWVDGRQQQVPMPRPITRHRLMHTAVDVYDGQTLVLANPQVTVVSKQPTGESVTNAVPEDAGKRLLVFITPTIIDPAGNPIHTPGKEPFPANRPPPQQVR